MKMIYKIGIGFTLFAGGLYLYKQLTKRNMKVSPNGIQFIKNLEGVSNKAYQDTKGLWTIGVGHLIKPNEQHLRIKILTPNEIDSLLKTDLMRFEDAVNDSITVPLTQNQFDALVSIAFNIGDSAFKKSSFVKRINAGEPMDSVLRAIALWKNPFAIIGRRAKEMRLYSQGNYSNQVATKELTMFVA